MSKPKSIYVVRMAHGGVQDFTAAIEYYGKEAVVVEVAKRQRKQNLMAAVMAFHNAGERDVLENYVQTLFDQGWISLPKTRERE